MGSRFLRSLNKVVDDVYKENGACYASNYVRELCEEWLNNYSSLGYTRICFLFVYVLSGKLRYTGNGVLEWRWGMLGREDEGCWEEYRRVRQKPGR